MKKSNKIALLFATVFLILGACGVVKYSEKSKLAQVEQENLIGGRAADKADWPASVYSSQGNSRCTSTVVGEKVLLIAAHCVSNGGSASFKIADKTYNAKCEHGPDYRRDDTADWALCVVSETVVGIPYENVNQDENLIKVGDEILLTGYGCILSGGGGGNDGTYRIGETKVIRVTQGDNDIVTRGRAALCYGDSGGPAFKYLDAEKKNRVQISVNSRGDISTTSYLSALHTPMAKKFFKDFTASKNVKICGVSADAAGCRSSVPDPQAECKNIYKNLGVCLFGVDKANCKDVYDSLLQCL